MTATKSSAPRAAAPDTALADIVRRAEHNIADAADAIVDLYDKRVKARDKADHNRAYWVLRLRALDWTRSEIARRCGPLTFQDWDRIVNRAPAQLPDRPGDPVKQASRWLREFASASPAAERVKNVRVGLIWRATHGRYQIPQDPAGRREPGSIRYWAEMFATGDNNVSAIQKKTEEPDLSWLDEQEPTMAATSWRAPTGISVDRTTDTTQVTVECGYRGCQATATRKVAADPTRRPNEWPTDVAKARAQLETKGWYVGRPYKAGERRLTRCPDHPTPTLERNRRTGNEL